MLFDCEKGNVILHYGFYIWQYAKGTAYTLSWDETIMKFITNLNGTEVIYYLLLWLAILYRVLEKDFLTCALTQRVLTWYVLSPQLPLESIWACLLQIMAVSVSALIVISSGTFLPVSVYIVVLFPWVYFKTERHISLIKKQYERLPVARDVWVK